MEVQRLAAVVPLAIPHMTSEETGEAGFALLCHRGALRRVGPLSQMLKWPGAVLVGTCLLLGKSLSQDPFS